jgi:hypothetical protein
MNNLKIALFSILSYKAKENQKRNIEEICYFIAAGHDSRAYSCTRPSTNKIAKGNF